MVWLEERELLRRLRRESAMPVIMLTARDTVVDKVSGLDMGADDYITKPFAIEDCWPASGRPCASAPPRPRSRPGACSPPVPSPWTPTGTR